ncbi:response regulator transcription factor [Paraflavitalea pollutisoli]|uniref:response regulator transcription factor n=1 Tax=Paraflavitalea pollutisoli TaxID=3034143 RepID=UPI0023ED05A4|nr:response regulator transcription factor [Paraflavitalea sp. H1-2-19X]
MKSSILLIEDEIDLGNVVKQYLEIMDFTVDWSQDGKAALTLFQANARKYDILLIDISLPGMDGFQLAEKIIQINPQTPFLFLTARNERADKLHGLKIGADDYITKPFDIDELVLRIRNIIKRHAGNPAVTEPSTQRSLIERGDVQFNKDSLKLVIGSHAAIMLTPRESELLEFLFNNENRILKREEILTRLWGENDYFLGRSLDVFISRLRKHLNKSDYISISNVYGVGFVFNVKEG